MDIQTDNKGSDQMRLRGGGKDRTFTIAEWAAMPDTIEQLRAELVAMTARKDGWRLIALAALRECYSDWIGGEVRGTPDYHKMFYMMNAELRNHMEKILAGIPIWKVRNSVDGQQNSEQPGIDDQGTSS